VLTANLFKMASVLLAILYVIHALMIHHAYHALWDYIYNLVIVLNHAPPIN
jgi:hypothetical protein